MDTLQTQMISPQEFKNYLSKSIDFDTYLERSKEQAEKVKSGNSEGIEHPEYQEINYQRLTRTLKRYELIDELKKAASEIIEKETWLVLTEHWCGDAAQSLGWVKKLADIGGDKVELRLVYRDENPELMEAFLTNGSKSIPKLIRLNKDLEVIGTWGPRPADAQAIVRRNLDAGEDYNNELHSWYAKNKGQDVQEDLLSLLEGN